MRLPAVIKYRYDALKYIIFQRDEDRHGYVRSPFVRIAAETVSSIKRDDLTLLSAGVAYYAVLSIFPLTLLLLSILRLFADSTTARARLEDFFAAYLPDSVGFVDQISSQSAGVSGLLGIVGFVGLAWGGTAMLSALTRAINRAFGISEDRPFYRQRPLTVMLGLALIAAFAVSIFGSAVIEVAAHFELPVIGKQTWLQISARLLPFGVTLFSFALIYKVLPNTKTAWRDVLPPAAFAALLFELAKDGFVFYVNRIATFEIYGSMTLLVVLLVWSYLSALIVLIGAEIVAVRRRISADTVDIAA